MMKERTDNIVIADLENVQRQEDPIPRSLSRVDAHTERQISRYMKNIVPVKMWFRRAYTHNDLCTKFLPSRNNSHKKGLLNPRRSASLCNAAVLDHVAKSTVTSAVISATRGRIHSIACISGQNVWCDNLSRTYVWTASVILGQRNKRGKYRQCL